MAIERMNYFKGEFLHAEDFQCEQKYHLDMRRRHNQYLHTPGIVDGLEVTAGAGKVTIAKGMAIDRNGKEIIMEGPKEVTISSVGVIGIKHKEEEDPASDNEDTTFPGKKRIKESYELTLSLDPDAIVLAKVINVSPVTLDPNFKPVYSGPAVMGDLVIEGDLTVKGTATTVNTETLEVEDNIIRVNKYAPPQTTPKNVNGGLEVYRGGTALNAQIIWDEGVDKWKMGVEGNLADIPYGPNADKLLNNSVAEGLHKHSSLSMPAGSPALSVDAAGNVGIGTTGPQDKLDIAGSLRVLTGSNSIRFTSAWSGFPDVTTNQAEISNDIGTYKTLMIVGNKSANMGRRVSVWDRLEVNGTLITTGDIFLKAIADDPGDIIFQNSAGTQKARIWSDPAAGVNKLHLSSGDNTPDITIDVAGNVGIGTAGPQDKLDIAGSLRVLTGSNSIRFTSAWSGFPDATTNQAEISNDIGTYKTLMIVGNKSAGLGRRVSVWDRLEVNGNTKVTGTIGTNGFEPTSGIPSGWGGGVHTWDVYAEGTVGCGSGGNLIIYISRDGSAFKPGGGSWGSTSDIKLKKNIKPLKGTLERLLKLRGVSYEWKEPEKQGNLVGMQMGLVADEVEVVFPEWVGTGPDGYKTLTVRGFEALAVEAFREINILNEELMAKNKEFENRIKSIEKKIKNL